MVPPSGRVTVMTNTKVKPAFRKPWEHGAYAYHEADTFAAALEGFRLRRKGEMFHMTNSGEAGRQLCVVCDRRLDETYPTNPGEAPGTKIDEHSTWTLRVSKDRNGKTIRQIGNGMHYGCSWSNLFNRIFKLADEGRIW